ncbi:MAG: TolC family protein [Gemmatimonadaceae bacterium]
MRSTAALILALAYPASALAGQATRAPLSRAQAVAAALARGARLGVARADTAAAAALLVGARAFQNPVLAAGYSKDAPQYHVAVELPLDLPGLRSSRIRSAAAGRDAARYRFQFERAAAALEADTTYTRALAARARAELSRRTAQDADSLRRMAAARRDAGDASDLDVELATVNAGQQANVAASDSLELIATLLDLQMVIGLSDDDISVSLTDSLMPPGDPEPPEGAGATFAASAPAAALAPLATPLRVIAAEAAVESARLATLAQRRGIFAGPSVSAGFDTGDPSGDARGILPTVFFALPLPFLDRNRGPVAQAEAEAARARAELALARLESRNQIARADRERRVALQKVARDQGLVVSANRVATMSLTAYREGAAPIATVLEAQRNAREVLSQYVDDLAAAWIATATLRVLTLTPAATAP